MSVLNRAIRRTITSTIETHKKKLITLWKQQRVSSPDCVKNFSNKELTIQEENAIRLGLKNHIMPAKVNSITIKGSIEKLICLWKLKRGPVLDQKGPLPKLLLNKIRHATDSFINAAKQAASTRINLALHKVLSNLRRDKTIRVCSFDKGTGIVILNADDYNKKLSDIVLDKSKFKEVKVEGKKVHPVISKERSITRFLNTHIKDWVEESVFKNILPSGSQPGKIYGLCKVHKLGNPLRPVVSMINTAEYNLAKYLDKIIKPKIPAKFMLNSTKSFLDKLKDYVFKSSSIIVSFDVVSLFTNIPLHETIDLISEEIYKHDDRPRYSKGDFKKLLVLATGGIFMFDNKFYCQTDGVTMGSPLGPTLANFFLAHFENRFMNQNLEFKPDLYCRFIDDVFSVFHNNDHINKFLNFLNNLHPNLQFTTELGPKTLAFLDTKIDLETPDVNFSSTVFRKKTNTNVLLNWDAFCPTNWKLGLIHCMLNRAYVVCNSWQSLHNEIQKLAGIFKMNGYPNQIFENCVNKFLDQKFIGKKEKKDEDELGVVRLIYCLPYFGQPSIDFRKKLIKLTKGFNLNLRVVYTTSKVSGYFSLKDKTPTELIAKCVYKFTCSCDKNNSYIGKTIRHLAIRSKEHLTGNSAIFDHVQNCRDCTNASLENFKILNCGNSDLEIKILEALQIKDLKPKMNNQLTHKGACYFLDVFT